MENMIKYMLRGTDPQLHAEAAVWPDDISLAK